MQHPPSNLSVIHRSPLHGLHLHIVNPNSNAAPTKLLRSYTSPSQALTVTCSEPHCTNFVTVTPHGTSSSNNNNNNNNNRSMQSASAESVMYIKARCNDCEPPVLVFDPWGMQIGEEREEEEEEEEEENGGE